MSLPPIVPFSLLEPPIRPHLCDEIQVMVKVLVNVAETIQQAASGTLIALPAPVKPLFPDARPDRALRIPPTLPAGWTVQLSDPPQKGEKYGVLLELRDLRGLVVGIEIETDFREFLLQCLDQMKELFIGRNAVRAAETTACRRIPLHFRHTRFHPTAVCLRERGPCAFPPRVYARHGPIPLDG